MPTNNQPAQQPPATAIRLVADLLQLTRDVSNLDPIDAGNAARLRARARLVLQAVAVKHPEILQAESIAQSDVSSGVAETTLGVEGLPLVQTGPGGDFTNKVHMELPRPDYSGMQAWFRKLGQAIGGKMDVSA